MCVLAIKHKAKGIKKIMSGRKICHEYVIMNQDDLRIWFVYLPDSEGLVNAHLLN